MTAPTRPSYPYALEDAELALAQHSLEPESETITVDINLFASLVGLSRQVRTWGG